MITLEYPSELDTVIGAEEKDFVVKAERAHPRSQALKNIHFAFVWLSFTSFIAIILYFGTKHSLPLFPIMIILLFIAIGVIVLVKGIHQMTQEGGWFVGTPSRLIVYQNEKIRSIDWQNFTGDIEISGNSMRSNIILKLRTGTMKRSSKHTLHYVPDMVTICGIIDGFEIEKHCRTRIKENDPTPSNNKNV